MAIIKALKNIDASEEVSRFESSLTRDGGVYVSALSSPLLVQTPAVTISSDLLENDEQVTFAHLKLKTPLLAIFRDIEHEILQRALAQRNTWFREDISDETIQQSFKSFIQLDDRTLRVRLADDLRAFDARKTPIALPGKGTRVKAVLELGRITFSKTQFGAVWNLKQVRLVEDSKYLFDEEDSTGIATDMSDSILAINDASHDENLEEVLDAEPA